jgi:hypothetical protein
MPLSGLPSGGPSIPSGATRVSIKEIDTAATDANYEDVTDLSSAQREYADPVLVEPTEGGGATATCSASGLLKGSAPTPTPPPTPPAQDTGWVCEDTEIVYEVGKYATWSANWSYYPPVTP